MAENPQVGVEVVGDWSKFDAEAAARQNMTAKLGPTMGTEGASPTPGLPPVSPSFSNPWTSASSLPGFGQPAGLGFGPWASFAPSAGPAAGGRGQEALGNAASRATAALEAFAAAAQRALPSPGQAYQERGLVRQFGRPEAYNYGGDEVVDAVWSQVQRPQLGWQGAATLPPGRGLPGPSALAGAGGGPAGGGPGFPYGGGWGGVPGGRNFQNPGAPFPSNKPWYWGLGNRQLMNPRTMFNVMFGLHEIAQTTQAVEDMELNSAYADTTEQSLQARIQGIHTATHGIFSGIASLAWDYSPWAASGPRETIRTLESAQFQMHTAQKTGDIMQQTRIANQMASATYIGNESLKRAQIDTQAMTAGRDIRKELSRVSEQLSAGSIRDSGWTLPWNAPTTPEEAAKEGTFQYTIQGAERSGLLGKQNALRQQLNAIERLRKAGQFEVDVDRDAMSLEAGGRRGMARLSTAPDREQELARMDWAHAVEMVREKDPTKQQALTETQAAERQGLVDRLDRDTRLTRHEAERMTNVHKLRALGASPEAIQDAARDARNLSALESLRAKAPELVPTFEALFGLEAAGDAEENRIKRLDQVVAASAQGVQAAGEMRVQARASGLRVEGKSVQARNAQIDYERQQAFNFANSIKDNTVANNVRAAATEKATADKTAAADAWQDQVRLMNMAASTTADVLQARRQRSPELAQAHETFGRARMEAFQFLEEHKGDPGARDIAVKNLDNSKTMLDLQRRDYLESFRGTEINLTKLRVDNVRDQEDPAVVLQGIREDMARLENLIQHIAD